MTSNPNFENPVLTGPTMTWGLPKPVVHKLDVPDLAPATNGTLMGVDPAMNPYTPENHVGGTYTLEFTTLVVAIVIILIFLMVLRFTRGNH
jgi:hypothetical protein